MEALGKTKWLRFIFALIIGAIVLYAAPATGLSWPGQKLLASLVVIMIIWATNAMDLSVSCLLLLLLFSWGAVDGTTVKNLSKGLQLAMSCFSDSVPLIVISGSIFASVVKSSGLAERFVYKLMQWTASKSGEVKASKILGAFYLAEVPASIMIPAAMGRCTIYTAIVEGLTKPFKFNQLSSGEEVNPFQKAMWMSVGLLPTLTAIMLLTGAGVTVMAGGIISQATGVEQYWSQVFAILFPPGIIVLFIAYVTLLKLFPSNIDNIKTSFVEDELAKMGKMTYGEKYCLADFFLMIVLFMTDKLHHIPAAIVLLLAAFALYIPGIGPGDWKKNGKSIPWNSYLLIGSALGMSVLLTKFGVMKFFTSLLAKLGITSFPVVLLTMIIVVILIRFGIASTTSATAMLVPVSLAFAASAQLPVAQIVAVGWATTVFCRITFFMPHQGAQITLSYGFDYYTRNDLMKAACCITTAAIIVYMLWCIFAVPFILA